MRRQLSCVVTLVCLLAVAGWCAHAQAETWTEDTFEDFADGQFDGGGNVFASAGGELKLVGQQWDLDGNDWLDIVISNTRDSTTYAWNTYSIVYQGSDAGFSPLNAFWGPIVFLCLFVVSALICAIIALGYPIFLFFIHKQHRQALNIVLLTTAWLIIFFLGLLSYFLVSRIQ